MQAPIDERARTKEFVRLLTAHSRRIYAYILAMLPNRADAEEVFQEVSVTLWDKFDDFEAGTSFGAWACRIAYYKVMQYRDRQRRRPTPFTEAFLEAVDHELLTTDESVDAEYRALSECLQKLSEEDRWLIEHRYQPGGSPHRLAHRLGLPVRRIYKSLSRIRKSLLVCVTRTLAEGGA